MDIKTLDASVREYIKFGDAYNTNISYTRNQRKYVVFCRKLGLNYYKPVERNFARYAAFRALSTTNKGSSIEQEMYGIASMYTSKFCAVRLKDMRSVLKLLKGIKRLREEVPLTRRPIGKVHLKLIFKNLGDNYSNVLAKALLATARSCMLRVSEYTINNGVSTTKQKYLKWRDVKFIPNIHKPEFVTLELRATKTSGWKPVTVGAACDCSDGVCAVHLLKQLKEMAISRFGKRKIEQAALFKMPNKRIVSRQWMSKLISSQMQKIGFDIIYFKPHSLRIGGACDLFEMGIDITTIKILGRWLSDAIIIYIKIQMKDILKALTRRKK